MKRAEEGGIHKGMQRKIFSFSPVSEIDEIRRDHMPYIECILSNVWQRRQMSMNLCDPADSNEQHVSGREKYSIRLYPCPSAFICGNGGRVCIGIVEKEKFNDLRRKEL